MITISLCMIVKNEEATLANCLDSLCDLVDEIIIVDTGSTDKTKEIAERFTDKIYDFEWIDDFSEARNFSFSKATEEYIFWFDADDVLLAPDRDKFRNLKETLDQSVDVVMMKYNYSFDEHGNTTLSLFRERLSKRSKGFRWIDPIHEYLETSGNIINSDIYITHKRIHSAKGRNLKIFESMKAKGKEFSPRNLYYFAKELNYNGRYDEAVEYFTKFLGTEKGWVEDNISACYEMSKCYKLLKDRKNALKALMRGIEYSGTPRAELCCELGYYYMDESDYEKAIFWFEAALNQKMPKDSWGFFLLDSWGYLPCIELCVCYFRLGKIEESIKYNNKAAEFKPNNASVLSNKKFFEEMNKNGELSEKAINILFPRKEVQGTKLTLSMIVKNEEDRYLKRVLEEHRNYIDEAVIIDDGSTDNSVQVCCEVLKGIPIRLIQNKESKFSNEVELRKQQWEETIKTNPDWILCMDADEIFENKFRYEIKNMLDRRDIDLYLFRLYDFWDENHYREDNYWIGHYIYWPFLVRYRKDYNYWWQDTPQHCGRLPRSVMQLPSVKSDIRLKHLGWIDPEERKKKYSRYMELDPEGKYGRMGQYVSIMDENPNLVEWIE